MAGGLRGRDVSQEGRRGPELPHPLALEGLGADAQGSSTQVRAGSPLCSLARGVLYPLGYARSPSDILSQWQHLPSSINPQSPFHCSCSLFWSPRLVLCMCGWSRGCRLCPRGARICTQLLPPQKHPQLPSRRGVAPHPVPPRLIPSRLILFHPVPHRTLPTARRDPPQRGEPQTPPGGRRAPSCAGGAHRDPVGSLTRLPRAQTGAHPAGAGCPQWPADVCRAAAGSQLRHVWLCPVSPGTDPDIPCSWLFVLSANCWHAVAACRALHRVRRCKPQASAALGTSSRGQISARLPKKPQIPVRCWQ